MLNAHETAIVCPTQFGTQCVPNREDVGERLHRAQVTLIEASPKFRSNYDISIEQLVADLL
jgi:hypothetical protein